MPQPTQSDVHVDAVLTNISIAYIQSAANFIAGVGAIYGTPAGQQIAYMAVATGSGVATGLSAGLSSALSSFAASMKSQTGTAQSPAPGPEARTGLQSR